MSHRDITTVTPAWRRELNRLTAVGVAEIVAVTVGLLIAMAILFCRGG